MQGQKEAELAEALPKAADVGGPASTKKASCTSEPSSQRTTAAATGKKEEISLGREKQVLPKQRG
jgi:hypothetical protein